MRQTIPVLVRDLDRDLQFPIKEGNKQGEVWVVCSPCWDVDFQSTADWLHLPGICSVTWLHTFPWPQPVPHHYQWKPRTKALLGLRNGVIQVVSCSYCSTLLRELQLLKGTKCCQRDKTCSSENARHILSAKMTVQLWWQCRTPGLV